MFAKGHVIGAYRIIRKIGAGAMGAVYEVEHEFLHRRFALKTITTLGDDESANATERFLQEARVMAQLSHVGIVSVQTLEVNPETGLPYFVMEYVAMPKRRRKELLATAVLSGQKWFTKSTSAPDAELKSLSLEDLYQYAKKSQARIHPEVVRGVLLDVCAALHYAHTFGSGILHRDIKPANILIREDGHAVIADFGVAKVMDRALRKYVLQQRARSLSLRLDRDGAAYHLVLGTREYMAPELLSGESPSVRTELYALGVTAYQLLTGEMFTSGAEPPSALGCDSLWDEVLHKCLRANPEERWESVAAFAEALEQFPQRQRQRRMKRVMGVGALATMALVGVAVGLGPRMGKVAFWGETHGRAEMTFPKVDPSLYLTIVKGPQGNLLKRVHPDVCGVLDLREVPLVHVEEEAFEGCALLTEVKWPASVKPPATVLSRFQAQPEKIVDASEPQRNPREQKGAQRAVESSAWMTKVLEDGTVAIEKCVLPKATKRIVVPEMIDGRRVTALSVSALANFKEATSLTLPDSITRIENTCFMHMEKLEEVTLPRSLKIEDPYLGRWMFQWCTNLKKVVFRSAPKYLTQAMFSHCPSLELVEIPGNVLPRVVGGFNFEGVPASFRLVLGNGVRYRYVQRDEVYYDLELDQPATPAQADAVAQLSNGLLLQQTSEGYVVKGFAKDAQRVKRLEIPEKHRGIAIVAIAKEAFLENNFLEHVVLPSTLKRIHEGAFRDAAIRRVDFVDGLELIGNGAFYGSQLQEAILPETVTTLGDGVFQNSQVKRFAFPARLTSCAGRTLAGCALTQTRLYFTPAMEVLSSGDVAGIFWECQNVNEIYLPNISYVAWHALVGLGGGVKEKRVKVIFNQSIVHFANHSLYAGRDATDVVVELHFPRDAKPQFEEKALSSSSYNVEVHVEGEPVRHWDLKTETWEPGPYDLSRQSARPPKNEVKPLEQKRDELEPSRKGPRPLDKAALDALCQEGYRVLQLNEVTIKAVEGGVAIVGFRAMGPYQNTLRIPAQIKGERVRRIELGAFRDYSFEHLYFEDPEGLIIESRAFSGIKTVVFGTEAVPVFSQNSFVQSNQEQPIFSRTHKDGQAVKPYVKVLDEKNGVTVLNLSPETCLLWSYQSTYAQPRIPAQFNGRKVVGIAPEAFCYSNNKVTALSLVDVGVGFKIWEGALKSMPNLKTIYWREEVDAQPLNLLRYESGSAKLKLIRKR